MEAEGLLPVRATVHLQGLAVGEEANVDPTDPYIAGLIEAQWLVPVEGRRLPSVKESPDGDAASQPPGDVGG